MSRPKVLLDVPHLMLEANPGLWEAVRIENDYLETGRMAADYFLERGFRHFACFAESLSSVPYSGRFYSGKGESEWSLLRCRGFMERLKEFGFEAVSVVPPCASSVSANWNRELPRIVKLLQELPKPLAIFTPHDSRGRQILDACRVAGVPVPYSVAVLGVNDDRTLCETAMPPLSSIPLRAEEAGYAAAKALDEVMRHGCRPGTGKVFRYGHLPVVTRDSTLNLQTDDPLVIAALGRIRDADGFGLRANELAVAMQTSLRNLNNHFGRALGRSVGDVIRETCFESVRRLVKSTDLAFKEIAARSGHLSVSHLAAAYRQRFGCTMSEDRKRFS